MPLIVSDNLLIWWVHDENDVIQVVRVTIHDYVLVQVDHKYQPAYQLPSVRRIVAVDGAEPSTFVPVDESGSAVENDAPIIRRF